MDVKILVPHGADISKIEEEYPDIYQDDTDADGYDVYFVGESSDAVGNERNSDNEWLTYDEAQECCGFVEGVMPGAEAMIEGSGEWAMSETRKNELYLSAFERGQGVLLV